MMYMIINVSVACMIINVSTYKQHVFEFECFLLTVVPSEKRTPFQTPDIFIKFSKPADFEDDAPAAAATAAEAESPKKAAGAAKGRGRPKGVTKRKAKGKKGAKGAKKAKK
ncbi:hypothetical protein ACJMK2_038542 [Sinanodonta woodiana]|uniref:Uncharacterized protein n=1 Tax=Sinanodonta woodiana TaxID=1069815 RepID=A0ABD3WCP7_SINWO